MKICDICGCPVKKGVYVRKIHNGFIPWTKPAYICEKCENTIKLMVLQHRKKREVIL